MNAEAAREALFGDSLACEETRPAAFAVGCLDLAAAKMASARAEGLLRALAIVEDSRIDDTEDHGAGDLALHRIEAKVDLLMTMMATLSQGSDRHDPARAVRWSAIGACLQSAGEVAPGTQGIFRIQPSDWLPESLVLPATVLNHSSEGAGGESLLWLRFGALAPNLQSELERHLFRVHRRAIAEQRRPR
ncbi:MAG: PilZ domain-containing protein [Pseudomonadota bacterium]|nr:PilZ domain-containing protein [Pseudomonadota bacterium]